MIILLKLIFLWLLLHFSISYNYQMSSRILSTERPYIEDILDRYNHVDNLTVLALGSSHWNPPQEALNQVISHINDRDTHRYGNIQGIPELCNELKIDLTRRGLDMENNDIIITSGANQAFVNIAIALIDHDDDVG